MQVASEAIDDPAAVHFVRRVTVVNAFCRRAQYPNYDNLIRTANLRMSRESGRSAFLTFLRTMIRHCAVSPCIYVNEIRASPFE